MNDTALDVERARALAAEGALLIDLRPIESYLERHVTGSIPLLFEDGPGLGGRARDLLPLDAKLLLIEDDSSPLPQAAAMFRGKGFNVIGTCEAAPRWNDRETSTTAIWTLEQAGDMTLIDVKDPGTEAPDDVLVIPAERLWVLAGDLDRSAPLGVLAGWGVRAAAAIGILENMDLSPSFVRTRPSGATPPNVNSDPTIFRVDGEA